MDLIVVNGINGGASYTLPCPSTYVGTESTVVDSGRNTKGKVIGSVVRESVAAVDATYNYITIDEWSKILKLFNSQYGGAFKRSVTFFNQVTGGMTTRTMYVADRTTGGMIVFDSKGKPRGWQNAQLSLVEV